MWCISHPSVETKIMPLLSADDVSELNRVPVFNDFHPGSAEEIRNIIRIESLPITMKGQSHTMGGQSLVDGGIIVDMGKMNRITNIDKNRRRVTVEAGTTWDELIRVLDNYGLSPMILQSYATFSVGGSLSVNAHGITSDLSLVHSVISLRYMDHRGELRHCSRHRDPEIFRAIVGGYGLFGIIIDVTLKVVDNCMLELHSTKTNIQAFNELYTSLRSDNSVEVKMARVDLLSPHHITIYSFYRDPIGPEILPKVCTTQDSSLSSVSRLLYKWLLPTRTGQGIRRIIEDYKGSAVDLPSNPITRNRLLSESTEAITHLYNPLIDREETHLLQEFFIPQGRFLEWMIWLGQLIPTIGPRSVWDIGRPYALLNLTIRFVERDEKTLLSYAPVDMYSFVFYYRLRKDRGDEELSKVHNRLAEKALELGGTFYLAYRPCYSQEQLHRSYPSWNNFKELKRSRDPNSRFRNLWWEKVRN